MAVIIPGDGRAHDHWCKVASDSMDPADCNCSASEEERKRAAARKEGAAAERAAILEIIEHEWYGAGVKRLTAAIRKRGQ